MTPTDGVNFALLLTSLVAAILGLIPLVIAALRVLRGRQSAQDLELLRRAAMDSVRAVEQTMKKASSEEKLAVALEQASKSLAIYGVRVTPDQLRTAVEAAVFLLTAGLELPEPPAVPDPVTVP